MMYYRSHSKSRAWLQAKIKETLKEEFPSFNTKQKAMIGRTAFGLAVSGESETSVLDSLFTVVSRCERHQDSIGKQKKMKEVSKESIPSNGFPMIFYLCSRHSNCAEDHTAYEGRLYYDRFWRTKYKGQPEWIQRKIQEFILRNKLLALQSIVKGPVWLTTRPYCKHFFTRVDTLEALTSKLEPPVTHGKRTRRGKSKKDIKKRLGI